MTDSFDAGAMTTPPASGAQPSGCSVSWAPRWLAGRRGQTALALAFALLVRGYFLVRARNMMEADEAIIGVQAERILHGALPVYLYGQAYMASWEAYLAAPLVAIFGPSGTILHVVTLLESLPLVPLMGALAARLFADERARLPAMLLAAAPPVYVGVVELHAWGGYVETLVIGAALLLVTLRIAARWAAGEEARWQWGLAGLLAGCGWWIDPLIIYYLVACALWLVLPALARFWRAREEIAGGSRRVVGQTLAGAAAFAGGALVGGLPAWLYLLTTPGALTPGQALPYAVGPVASGLKDLPRLNIAGYFALLDAPRVAGITIPWPPFAGNWALVALVGLIPALAALAALWAGALLALGALRVLRRSRAEWRQAPASPAWTGALPVILALVIFLIFWRSPATVALGRNLDTTGRYAIPLTTVISLLLVSVYLRLRERWTSLTAPSPVREPRTRTGASLFARPARRAGGWWMAPALLGLLLVTYAAPYAVTNQPQALESTYALGLRFPAEHTDLITYLERRHITAVWADHWIGNVIYYLTDQRIAAADYYDVAVFGGRDRFPEALAAVARADHPSFIYRDPSAPPWMATAMRRLGVGYDLARFGDIWVITPLSRTVTPLELARAGCDITPLRFDQPSCAQLGLGD